MSEPLFCWKCGASIAEQPLPLSRTAECRQCSADLYVCKMCMFYDTSKAKSCQESIADEVRDKERANFCDYLKLNPKAYVNRGETAQENARRQLEALFGNSQTPDHNASKDDAVHEEKQTKDAMDLKNPQREALEKLFKK